MAKFKKKVLEPGTYHSPDGVLVITKDRIKHWADSFKEMKNARINVPTPWGHQKLGASYEDREYLESKFNAGFIEDLNVNDDGELIAVLDIPREEDANKVGTIVREVSPQIETKWKDGKGREWDDVITHLALVTKPVVPEQDNFESLPPQGGIRLSLRYKLSLEEEEKYMDGKGKEKEKEVEVGGGEIDSELLDALASVGLHLPEGLSKVDFVPALKAAALTLKAKGGEAPGEEGNEEDLFKDLDLSGLGDEEGKENEEEEKEEKKGKKAEAGEENVEDLSGGGEEKGKGPIMEQQPSYTMSTREKALEARLALFQSKLEDADRTRLDNEISLLLSQGKITPVIANELRKDLGKYKLSLNSKDEPQTSILAAKIETFKLMPEGSAWSNDDRVRLRNSAEEDLPSEFKSLTEEAADKIADRQLKACGRTVAYEF